MMTLFERAIKLAAAKALEEQLDTLVTVDDLEITKSIIWRVNHTYYVTCPEFDDFEVQVKTDAGNAPISATVYEYQ